VTKRRDEITVDVLAIVAFCSQPEAISYLRLDPLLQVVGDGSSTVVTVAPLVDLGDCLGERGLGVVLSGEAGAPSPSPLASRRIGCDVESEAPAAMAAAAGPPASTRVIHWWARAARADRSRHGWSSKRFSWPSSSSMRRIRLTRRDFCVWIRRRVGWMAGNTPGCVRALSTPCSPACADPADTEPGPSRRGDVALLARPGINPSGRFGGRIEDIVAVTNTCARRSTNTDSQLRIVS